MICTKFWRILTDIAYIFTLLPYILNHKYRTGKYGTKVTEKFGKVAQRSSNKDCLQIHAVSVGEVVAAAPIIREFSSKFPDWDIHITVSTATGLEVANKRYPNLTVTYFPLDLSLWVKRFLRAIRPTAIILMELEIWPNFLSITHENKIPLLIANGRITERSAASYQKYHWFPVLRNMLKLPDLWLAQDTVYAERFKLIGVNEDRIRILGNVKYDAIPTQPDSETGLKYRKLFQADADTKIIMAGSTHSPEERYLLEAFSTAQQLFPNLILIIVPRHPQRFEEVYAECCSFGNTLKYTALENTLDNTAPERSAIILIDKMGILSELYNAADIVFIGGSFIDHGGQNMLEPCGLGKPTIIGPSYYNFTDTVEILKNAEGIKIEDNPEELGQLFFNMLTHPQTTDALANAGREALLKRKGCARRTIETLSELLASTNRIH